MPLQKFRQFDEFFRELNQIHTKFHQFDEFFLNLIKFTAHYDPEFFKV